MAYSSLEARSLGSKFDTVSAGNRAHVLVCRAMLLDEGEPLREVVRAQARRVGGLVTPCSIQNGTLVRFALNIVNTNGSTMSFFLVVHIIIIDIISCASELTDLIVLRRS